MFGSQHLQQPKAKKDDDYHQPDGRRVCHGRVCGLLLGALVLALFGLIAAGQGGTGSGGPTGAENGVSVDTRVNHADPVDGRASGVEAGLQSAPARDSSGDSAARSAGVNSSSSSSVQRAAHTTPASPSAPTKRKAARKRVWVTEELEEYASLITDEVEQAWAQMETDPEHTPSPFTPKQSEFYAALTLLSLNVSTVCELGAGDGRSAITWLEALPWTRVVSFGRAPELHQEDSGSTQADGSFGPPPPPPPLDAVAEDLTTTPVGRAKAAQQAFARQYLRREYGQRYTWVQLSRSISAAEVQRVAAEQSIAKCDVVTISAAMWAEIESSDATAREQRAGSTPSRSALPLRRDEPSIVNTPLPRLKAELLAMRELTRGWHFLLVDGMGCSDQAAAKAAAVVASDETTPAATGTAAAVAAGGLRGPAAGSASGSTRDGSTPVGGNLGAGDCPINRNGDGNRGGASDTGAAQQQKSAAVDRDRAALLSIVASPPPQRVRATWESVVEAGVVVEYECRTGWINSPGWCLGTYRAPLYSNIPGGGSWPMGGGPLSLSGQSKSNQPEGFGGDDDDMGGGAPRVLPWLSSEGMYLNVGDELKSREESFYLSMQEDGNLVIYNTVNSHSEQDAAGGEAKAVWSSRTSGSVGNYFLALQVRLMIPAAAAAAAAAASPHSPP